MPRHAADSRAQEQADRGADGPDEHGEAGLGEGGDQGGALAAAAHRQRGAHGEGGRGERQERPRGGDGREGQGRAGRGRALRVFLAGWAALAALMAVWALSDPIMAGPDEPSHAIKAVAVVRGQGPRANGMPELHKLTPPLAVLQGQGLRVALVTDGRMSGASGKVPAAIHASPEALAGGPLAKVRNGDLVRLAPGPAAIIDEVPNGRLYVDGGILVTEQGEALKERRHASTNGVLIVSFALDKRGRIASDIDIRSVGLPGDIDTPLGDALDDLAERVEQVVKSLKGEALEDERARRPGLRGLGEEELERRRDPRAGRAVGRREVAVPRGGERLVQLAWPEGQTGRFDRAASTQSAIRPYGSFMGAL